MTRCCPTYLSVPCLFANEEQTATGDDIEVTVLADTLYTSSTTASNCIALELAEKRHYAEVCEIIPIADPQSLVTGFEEIIDITLTGSSAAGDLIFTILTLPTNGTLNGDAPNLTYTPFSGFSGVDSFTFSVNNGAVESEPAEVEITVTQGEVFEADFITIQYRFDDGEDLDTRTSITAPLAGDEVGWCQNSGYMGPNDTIWYEWAGDNTDQGFESVLIYVENIRLDFPGATIEGLCKCWWYDVRDSGDMYIRLTAYKGGAMELVPGEYRWVNIGGEETATLDLSKNITRQDSECITDPECVSGFSFDVSTNSFLWTDCP